jgi:hypothetical protein
MKRKGQGGWLEVDDIRQIVHLIVNNHITLIIIVVDKTQLRGKIL